MTYNDTEKVKRVIKGYSYCNVKYSKEILYTGGIAVSSFRPVVFVLDEAEEMKLDV